MNSKRANGWLWVSEPPRYVTCKLETARIPGAGRAGWKRRVNFITLILVGVATVLSVTCSHAIDVPAQAGVGKRLKTIIEDHYQPYSFVNEQGQPDGFSIEIARAVAKTMDFELDMRAGEWDFALKELESGQIDLIPIIAYSPEWEKIYNYSVPYTVVYDAIFIRKGTTGISSLKDLSGKTVIVTNNDLAHNYLMSSGLNKTMNIVLVKSGPDALKQLAAGKGDAAIMPKLIGLVTVKKLNLVAIETSPLLIDSYTRSWGFAVKAGNLALLERLNQGLNIIKSSGEYDAIYKKWFGALEDPHFNLKIVLRYGSGAMLIFLGIISWNLMLKRQVKAKTDNLVAEIDRRKQAEESLRESGEALRESEERFRVAQDLSPDGFTILKPLRDAQGRVIDFTWVYENATIARLNGTDPQSVVGQRLLEIFPGHHDSPFLKAYKQVAETGEPCAFEESYHGETISEQTWFRIVVVPTGGYIAILAQDITKRKRAEEVLRQRAEELRASNAELELFNRAAVGRELRMIELKEEINELCRRLGEPPRH